MIPKVIHYCWFGRNPLPKSAQKCIASWRKYFPDYEIKEWNEDNFDVNMIPFTREAYERKKYAFVSDYVRFWALYREGGVYFDTDVEVIRPFDDILRRGPFMGCEIDAQPQQLAGATAPAVAPGLGLGVNPGLGLGVNPGLGLYKEILDYYADLHFVDATGRQNEGTVVYHTTQVLLRHGLTSVPGIQQVGGIYIYPQEYFNPLDDATGVLKVTANTRSIHWYSKTWTGYSPMRVKVTRLVHRYFGVTSLKWLRKLLHK